MKKARSFKIGLIALTAIFISNCANKEKEKTNSNEVVIFDSDEPSLHTSGDTILLNIDPRRNQYQLVHIENKKRKQFAIIGKVEASSINEDTCKLESITLTAQSTTSNSNPFYIKKIYNRGKVGDTVKFDVEVDLVRNLEQNVASKNLNSCVLKCDNNSICRISCDLNNMEVTRNTIFDYHVLESPSLKKHLDSIFGEVTEPMKRFFCCGVICKTTFSF